MSNLFSVKKNFDTFNISRIPNYEFTHLHRLCSSAPRREVSRNLKFGRKKKVKSLNLNW